MCRKLILLVLILQTFVVCVNAQSILKNIGNKAANAGGDLIINKAKKKADKALDGNSGKKSGNKSDNKSDKSNNGKEEKTETVKVTKSEPVTGDKGNKLASVSSKFDFVPGEKILLFDNFEQDVLGEFPLKWYTNGSGEIVKLDGYGGKWLQFNSGSFLTPEVNISENFTVEFDLFLNLSRKSTAVLPAFVFEFHDRGDKAKRLNAYNYELNNLLVVSTGFMVKQVYAQVDSREQKKVKMKSDRNVLPGFEENYGSAIHVAVSVQKERLRVWYNTQKVFDMPGAVAVPHNFNQMKFYGEKTREGYPGFYITNLKIATGTPDMRSKLLEQGKLVTHGILFDINSDKVKPESYGVIREVANAIKEADQIKVKIIGHTDSDGNAEANLELSRKRAASVKEILVKEFGISEDQLTTDGMGASQPINKTNTAAGKAENRRVEFIKI